MEHLILCSKKLNLEQLTKMQIESTEISFDPRLMDIQPGEPISSFNGIDELSVELHFMNAKHINVVDLTNAICQFVYRSGAGILNTSPAGDDESHMSYEVAEWTDGSYCIELALSPKLKRLEIITRITSLETWFTKQNCVFQPGTSNIGFFGDSIMSHDTTEVMWTTFVDSDKLSKCPVVDGVLLEKLLKDEYINVPEHEKEL
jgi:hypothetical protein